jgi:hypothetical protein
MVVWRNIEKKYVYRGALAQGYTEAETSIWRDMASETETVPLM